MVMGLAPVFLLQRLVGGDHVEFLLCELLAGRLDLLAVLRNPAFQLGLALLVEGDAALRGGELVAVGVELLAELIVLLLPMNSLARSCHQRWRSVEQGAPQAPVERRPPGGFLLAGGSFIPRD
jgi:hypothetical protein